ncbi:hypothetical protein CPC08DRAFT_709867, partial [Agrocybe pediades]
PTATDDITVSTIKRDDYFYVDTIVFQVEDTLFRVPRWGFEDPECFFADMFKSALPGSGPNGEQIEGTSDDSPIVLEGESKLHFRAFLKALYSPIYKIIPDPGKPYNSNLDREVDIGHYDEWLGVLHLATKWHFVSIRKQAIQKVKRLFPEKMKGWDKIAIARKYNVREWLEKEYVALVNQSRAHNIIRLCEKMGISEAYRVLQLRENNGDGGRRQISRDLILKSFAPEIKSVGTE